MSLKIKLNIPLVKESSFVGIGVSPHFTWEKVPNGRILNKKSPGDQPQRLSGAE
jgi:hypothetical protein